MERIKIRMIDAQNEITEKCYLIKNDISVKNEITAKIAADFAVTYYKVFRENYDEKTFVYIIKKVMEFFNKAVIDIPKRKLETDAKKLTNDIDSLKEEVHKFSKILFNKNFESSTTGDFSKEDLELYESDFKEIKKELKTLELNKPFFLLRWSWKKKIKKELSKLELLEKNSYNLYESFYENNKEKNRILEEIYLDIRKHLKSFMSDVKPNIGEELADIPYEYVIEGIDELKSFVFDVVISNFYQYYTLKIEK